MYFTPQRKLSIHDVIVSPTRQKETKTTRKTVPSNKSNVGQASQFSIQQNQQRQQLPHLGHLTRRNPSRNRHVRARHNEQQCSNAAAPPIPAGAQQTRACPPTEASKARARHDASELAASYPPSRINIAKHATTTRVSSKELASVFTPPPSPSRISHSSGHVSELDLIFRELLEDRSHGVRQVIRVHSNARPCRPGRGNQR